MEFRTAPHPTDPTRWVVSLPLPDGDHLVVEAPCDWPRDGRVQVTPLDCWPVEEWPEGLAGPAVASVPVVDVTRRGPSLDVVLDRGNRHRCRFVLGPDRLDKSGSATADATDVLWWQTGASSLGTPPRQRVPTARERGVCDLTVVVDSREQRPWTFADATDCVVESVPGKLHAGDYGVLDEHGSPVAVVERKKAGDFASCLTTGRLSEQMSVLATLPRAAVVVEASYSRVLNRKRVARGRMADLVAAVQASFPDVPIVFAGTRDAAEEWTWRYLAAAWSHHLDEQRPLLAG